jgi:D-amino-acid oxidase
MSASKAIVVGAGVSGLSSAMRLLESGFEVEIWTRDLPARTTSSVAGAIWYPYAVGADQRVERWARESYVEFERLARVEGSGVSMRGGVEFLARGAHDANARHRAHVPRVQSLPASELPERFDRGFELALPIVEMPLYLDYLRRRFTAAGGRIVERALTSFDEALDAAPHVINCVGLAARELCGDGEMFAIRGQVVRVERADVERFVLDDYDPRGVTYVVPRSRDCVLGGTSEARREDLVPDEDATRAILARCAELEPKLRGCQVLSVAVGLRPGRSSVRVASERAHAGNTLVHNYGHGGAGVTLSWGCANEVLALVCGTARSSHATRS